jgi:ABC-type uncharacterized transport system auxiliary subunit
MFHSSRFGRRLVAAALVVLTLSGCAGGAAPTEHYYRLDAATPDAFSGQSLDANLEVQRFTADALLSRRPIAYAQTDNPQDLQQYHYHFWTDPPPRLLQVYAVEVLRGAGVANQVLTPEVRPALGYELRGNIQKLEHLRGSSPRVVVELEFALTDARNDRLLWLETFRVERPVSDPSVAAATQAMNEALDQIFAEMLAHWKSA